MKRKTKPLIMGCYAIGVSRTVAAIAEQFNDENGLVWPKVSHVHVHVIPVNMKSDAQREMGGNIYNSLQEQGYEYY